MGKSIWQEFKEFALKGNAIDLAVGVVIGAAFGGVVKSLVDDIIMPPLGLLTGGVDFSNKVLELKPLTLIPGEKPRPPVEMHYGIFINDVINFVLVAAAIFAVIKLINMMHRKPPDPEVALPPTLDQQLLMEIRDALKAGMPLNAPPKGGG